LVELAVVHRQAGHLEHSRAAMADALQLYERKGNAVAAERARAELAELPRL
jgi:hypothetical protein